VKLISIAVGLPREIEWQGRKVRTSIFKSPVTGPVQVSRLNIDGDKQSDLTVHGGPDKAVYAYPSEHYPFWRENFPALEFDWGMLGENLTVEGLDERTTHIGDRFGVGSAEFVVTQPRMPCYKLGIRLGDPRAIKILLQSRRSGFYFAVAREGVVTAGDPIRLIERDEHGISVTDIVDLYGGTSDSPDLLNKAINLPSLPASWRDYFRKRISQ
jgi:MOSC domain-containing protein YiiM